MENIDKPTKRLYFNVEITNNTTENILAKSETTLLKPLFRDPENWDLCINRFRLPLNGIPLTRNNIPFEQWQVSLGFYNNSQWTYKSSYVPQYNPAYKTVNIPNTFAFTLGAKYLSINPDLTNPQTYTTTSLTDFNSTIQPTYDLYNDIGTYYYVSVDQSNVYCVFGSTTTTIPITANNVTTCIFVDQSTNDLYISLQNQSAGTQGLLQYTRTGDNEWTSGNFYEVSNGTYTINSIAVFDNQVFAMCSTLNLGVDNVSDLIAFTKGNVYSTGSVQFYNPLVYMTSINDLMYVAVDAALQTYNSGLNQISTISLPSLAAGYNAFLGFDINNNILLNLNTSNIAIDTQGNTQYSFPNENYFLIFNSFTPTQVLIDSGEYYLWTYQDFLTQINSALKTSFTQISTAFSGTYTPTKAPELFFDPASRLFYIQADKAYTDSTTYTIDFNQILYNMFLFPSLPDNNLPGSKSILIQDVSGSSPDFLNIYQESSSVAKFYDLVRILIQTSRIPVSGDSELANNSQLIITDVVPDTDTLSPSGLLIYQPTVLRYYNMYATSPFGTVDIYFSYGTKSGNIYPIYIVPNEYASCKIQFQKGQ